MVYLSLRCMRSHGNDHRFCSSKMKKPTLASGLVKLEPC
jgi:hypothetical protein